MIRTLARTNVLSFGTVGNTTPMHFGWYSVYGHDTTDVSKAVPSCNPSCIAMLSSSQLATAT